MKLPRVTEVDPVVRRTVGLHQSVFEKLELYQKMYKNHYGDEISLSLVLEEMAKSFMETDRDFAKYCKDNENASPSTPKVSSAGPMIG